MDMIELIRKKRDAGRLTAEEIRYFVSGYTHGRIPDYQAAAFLMAIWFRGMDGIETTELTRAMERSGERVDLSAISGVKVDKHSTGGVADTTTLIVGPLVAACGGKVAKMSGRGLGHTGGTLDKLESIPGFSVEQSMENFARIVSETGLSVIGQTENLVPADKMLYALRDVTGTIDSIPLIAASIMSKKLASGSDAIVLDVKTGSGAFMKASAEAEELARLMVEIGRHAGKRTAALVTDMNQPLGMAVGNALEVREAIQILRGEGGGDLLAVSVALASKMLVLSGLESSSEKAATRARDALASGRALARLSAMIRAQGGDARVVDDPLSILPRAAEVIPVKAGRRGFISSMNTEEIGTACLLLGSGRRKKDDPIDPAVGIWMEKRIGDEVEVGEPIGWFHVNARDRLDEARERFTRAVSISGEKPDGIILVHAVIE